MRMSRCFHSSQYWFQHSIYLFSLSSAFSAILRKTKLRSSSNSCQSTSLHSTFQDAIEKCRKSQSQALASYRAIPTHSWSFGTFSLPCIQQKRTYNYRSIEYHFSQHGEFSPHLKSPPRAYKFVATN